MHYYMHYKYVIYYIDLALRVWHLRAYTAAFGLRVADSMEKHRQEQVLLFHVQLHS